MANDQWRTPPHIIAMVHETMGGIDLDPASSRRANQAVGAKSFADHGGLSLDWTAHQRVFCNPPYSEIRPWVDKFIDEVTHGIMLTNADTSTAWSHELMNHVDAVCFTKGRLRFIDPETEEPRGGNSRGQAIWFVGDWRPFEKVFRRIGTVLPL